MYSVALRKPRILLSLQSSTSHERLPHYVILAEHKVFHAYLYIQVYMGMSKHLSWVDEFYSGSLAVLWIMCSLLVEGLRNESVGYELPVLEPDRPDF